MERRKPDTRIGRGTVVDGAAGVRGLARARGECVEGREGGTWLSSQGTR